MTDIFVGALLFAIWGVLLFYGKAIGLSMLIFAVPITIFIIKIIEKRQNDLNKKAKILVVPITLLSSTYLIFNNFLFNALNILVIPTLVILMILGLYKEKFEIKLNIIKKVSSVIFKPFEYIGDAFKKSRKIFEPNKNLEENSKKSKNLKRVLKALVITIPVVFVILWLLSSADQIFGSIFGNITEFIENFIAGIQLSTATEIIILILFTFVYFMGFFYYVSSKFQILETKEKEEKKKDSFTIKMILVTLNVIYIIFCIIQIKSLFMRQVNINYAEYARQGFFQLMIVSLINLYTVLIAKKREMQDEIKTKFIKIMCLVMLVCTFIILISATYRMYLYESAYGYTILRLLVYCILFTETILLVPTILYIIDKKINLPITYFTIIISVYVCMNFANFDNIIAKRNVDRYIETGKIDVLYLEMGTGTDAINQIMRILDYKEKEVGINPEVRRYLSDVHFYLESEQMDFRDFNFSKLLAKKKISERLEQIVELMNY